MNRQHAAPVHFSRDGTAIVLERSGVATDGDGWDEDRVQALVHNHPACLPVREIDPIFADPIPICRELYTAAGPIDNLLITPSGLPVLVECRVWRNPQARREVVGQIIDYAKELSRWSSSDLQREVRRCLRSSGDPVVELIRAAGHAIDEVAFNDALTFNLRRGRFLLLIVGDGIREGVEAIADYIQAHAGLHFTLGLVELPIYTTPDGGQLVAPRVLARTLLVTRDVVAVPDGFMLQSAGETDGDVETPLTPEENARRDFMIQVAAGLALSDPEQRTPEVTRKGYLYLYMPVPSSSCWIGALYKRNGRQIGIRLTSNANTIGEAAIAQIIPDWPDIQREIGGRAVVDRMSPTRFRIEEFLTVGRPQDRAEQEEAAAWLRERLATYVSVLRPRIQEAARHVGS